MSQGVTHFAVGAACTTLVVTFLVPSVRYPRTAILAGGIWAMLPDAGKVYSHPLILRLHDSRWMDLFWLHYTLDRLDRADSSRWGAVALVAFLVMTIIAERRWYRALAPIENRVGGVDLS